MHKPRKRFGQHFLTDDGVIQALINCINPHARDCMVEIGPGQGALTFPLLKHLTKLSVVELDRDLLPILQHRSKGLGDLTIYEADALTFNFSQINSAPKSLRVVGNLPYNISTPLIFHLLAFSQQIIDMHFMLQKEVVQRLAATPGDHHYGRLSVMVQYFCEVTQLFDVAPDAFDPPPKVDSSIVRMIPYVTLPWTLADFKIFADVVKLAFAHRRKTLKNCLKNVMTNEHWQQVSIDPQTRAEQLSVQNYVDLSNFIFKSKGTSWQPM